MTQGARVVVAIPAKNEEARIGAALRAVHLAVHRLQECDPTAAATIVVAADACADSTAAIARAMGAVVVETPHGRVGAARAAAVRTGLAAAPDASWIANTDADSQVPSDWLITHLAAARDGADLLLGSVRPDELELGPARFLEWLRQNPPTEHHGFIHGANLGIRAEVYTRLGGFAGVAVDEDVQLVGLARRSGMDVRATDRAPVSTSGRTTGRTPGGFSEYIRKLMIEPGPLLG